MTCWLIMLAYMAGIVTMLLLDLWADDDDGRTDPYG